MSLYRIIIIWMLLIQFISSCLASTLTVGPGESIQVAIALARPGDTIEVESGIYYDHLRVDKPLILRGKDMPVLDATASGSAITLMVSGIIVEGFRIKNAGSWPNDDAYVAGIKVLSDGNRIDRNNVSNNFNGILILGSNNTVGNNVVGYNLGFGIRIENASNNTLQGNHLEDNRQNAFDDGRNFWEKNYYSDFGAPKDGCSDEDRDGLCDLGHAIPGGKSVDPRPLSKIQTQ
jgi:nitrous oxidase accessory protein